MAAPAASIFLCLATRVFCLFLFFFFLVHVYHLLPSLLLLLLLLPLLRLHVPSNGCLRSTLSPVVSSWSYIPLHHLILFFLSITFEDLSILLEAFNGVLQGNLGGYWTSQFRREANVNGRWRVFVSFLLWVVLVWIGYGNGVAIYFAGGWQCE